MHSHRNSVQDQGVNTDEYMGFNVKWGSSIHVPNVENRLIFQNHIYDNIPQNTDGQDPNSAYIGSTFALYEVGESLGDDPVLYYLAEDGTPIYLKPDPKRDGRLTNEAWLVDPETGEPAERNIGNYEIIQTGSEAGTIRVTMGDGREYTIKPATNASGEPCIKNTLARDAEGNLIKEDGANQFERLRKGRYVLRQITAPVNPQTNETYAINIAEAKVEVTDRAIFANAGGDRNGVLVGNGVGYVVKTLAAFASQGVVDETLSWLASCLRVSKAQTFSQFQDFLNGQSDQYGKTRDPSARPGISSETTNNFIESMTTYLEYVAKVDKKVFDYDVTEDQTADSRSSVGGEQLFVIDGEGMPHLYTDEGWSKLAIYQDIGYAQEHRNTNAAYENMPGRDITHLFSNATFVDFYNSPAVNPSIVKVEAGTEEYSDDSENKELLGYKTKVSGAKFRVSRLVSSQTDASGEIQETWEYYSQTCENEQRSCTFSWISDSNKAYIFTSDTEGNIWQNVSLDPYHDVDGNVVPWQYRLEEVQAPRGYKKLTEPIRFELYNEENAENPDPGIKTGAITMIQVLGEYDPAVRVGNDSMTMYVGNAPDDSPQPDPPVTLPAAGATTWWWLMPLGLILLTMAMLIARYRSSSYEE